MVVRLSEGAGVVQCFPPAESIFEPCFDSFLLFPSSFCYRFVQSRICNREFTCKLLEIIILFKKLLSMTCFEKSARARFPASKNLSFQPENAPLKLKNSMNYCDDQSILSTSCAENQYNRQIECLDFDCLDGSHS